MASFRCSAWRVAGVFCVLLAVSSCGAAGALDNQDTGTVGVKNVTMSACVRSAAPLPGWIDCTATATVVVTKTVSIGYLSVYFNYPDPGSFYHGQIAVGNGAPGTVTVNLVNDYIPSCVTSYQTTVDIYNGPESAKSAQLLGSIPLKLTVTC